MEIHVAGPMIDWVQRCTRCNYILSDYRNSMIPEGNPPPRGWAVGTNVEVDGSNPRYSLSTDNHPTCRDQSKLLDVGTHVHTTWTEPPYGVGGIIIGYGEVRDVDDQIHPTYIVLLADPIEQPNPDCNNCKREIRKYRAVRVVVLRQDRTQVIQ